VLAGRKSYLAGRIGLQKFGLASSPNEGLIWFSFSFCP
jgi:thiazole synthase ThiGH ThiG subunit